jgi:osmotically-inducible protein OsmY
MALITRDRSEHSGTAVGDRDVKTTVVSRLRENPYTQDAHIGVEVHDGVVHLTGEVHSSEERTVAAEDVQTVPGVTEVQDDLTIPV